MNLDPNMRYYALHKPAGVVTTMDDPQGRTDIRPSCPGDGPRVFPSGRLDRDTEGLLLLTNDGELANRLMHPRFGVEKEYLAEVEGEPTAKRLAQRPRRRGTGRRPGARRLGERHGPVGGPVGAVRVVMTEGRKREVRRLLAAVELPVRAAGADARGADAARRARARRAPRADPGGGRGARRTPPDGSLHPMRVR